VKAVPMDACQGEKFSQEPKKQETKKQKKMSNWHWWTDKVAKTSKTKKKVSTHGKDLRRSWTGDMGWNFVLFYLCFSMVLDQFFPLSEFGLFVCDFGIDPSSRNGSRSADRMILSKQCKTCVFLQCARLQPHHPPFCFLSFVFFFGTPR
jgi:hypothetical protein